jgi:hypothetical protein
MPSTGDGESSDTWGVEGPDERSSARSGKVRRESEEKVTMGTRETEQAISERLEDARQRATDPTLTEDDRQLADREIDGWEGVLGDFRASGELPQQLDGFEGSQGVVPEPA